MKRIYFLLLIIPMLMLSPLGAASDEGFEDPEDSEDSTVIEEPVPIQVTLNAFKESVFVYYQNNIFTFTVAPVSATGEQSYNVLLYVDGQYVGEYKNKNLPFSFQRNFSGRPSGAHQVRVDIEHLGGNLILARQEITVYVEAE